ncbi:hypothetical protein DRJ25_04575 [Candidatus Woesearchaeota archaeon]|nr:MAG: hypothetical protein DRJ25_04575 [Candidatus Woesearchaeota archaeon]
MDNRINIKLILAWLFFSLLLPAVLWANENLLPNGSFEITTVPAVPDCYYQYLGPKNVDDWYELWTIDHEVAFDGHNSIRLEVKNNNQIGKLCVRHCLHKIAVKYQGWSWPARGKKYTFSVYLKSNQDSIPVRISFITSHLVKVEKYWKRYSFTENLSTAKYEFPYFSIVPKGVGKLWIDCLQLENGSSASSFKKSSFDNDSLFEKKITSLMTVNEFRNYVASIKKQNILQMKTGLSFYTGEQNADLIVSFNAANLNLRDYDLSLKVFPQADNSSPLYSEKVEILKKQIIKSVDISQFQNGSYNVVALLSKKDGSAVAQVDTVLRKFAPENGVVKIDQEHRVLMVNGNHFPFVGACFLRVHDYLDSYTELLQKLKNHGYTCIIATFANRTNDERASISEIRGFLDYANNIGLKVIIWINPNAVKDGNKFHVVKSSFEPDVVERKFKEEMERIIPIFRKHPALLAWYPIDEPYRENLINYGITKKLSMYAKQLDPYHPVMINYGGLKADYDFNNGTVPGDMVSSTQYPIPLWSVTEIVKNTALEDVASEGKKPVSLWLQFWGGQGRYPTADEFSCMFYLSVVGGANGLQTWPMMPCSQTLWNRARDVIAEYKLLFPIITAEKEDDNSISCNSSHVFFTLRQRDGKIYLIAVNSAKISQNVSFSIIDHMKSIAHVKDFFDQGIIEHNVRSFNSFFKPYERHVYEIAFNNVLIVERLVK